MSDVNLTIRINYGNGAVDWNVERPDLITFQDAMDAIHYIIGQQQAVVQAFEYEDEDGERITVRSDGDIKNMINYHVEVLKTVGAAQPLVIFPKSGRAPSSRNVENLTVRIESENGDKAQHAVVDNQEVDHTGSRKRSSDIREILSRGQIVDSDLHYLRMLGHGNCGTVYMAQHRPTAAIMAVKHISLDITVDAQNQIIAELEILYRCHSPLIISFYGAYFLENRISMCTEYMDGGSLDKYGQIPEQILGRVAVSVVKGLQYLWSLKIMHRDVKPSNILVNTQGFVKLCDFGVSVQLIDSIAKTFIGTNAYMAPERIAGDEYGIHAEVWSIGVSFFEMSVGRFPYESVKRMEAKPIDLLKNIVEQDPPKLPNVGIFSEAFIHFVAQCMTKIPQHRPSLEVLLHHPFILQYSDSSLLPVVAQWVRQQLIIHSTAATAAAAAAAAVDNIALRQ